MDADYRTDVPAQEILANLRASIVALGAAGAIATSAGQLAGTVRSGLATKLQNFATQMVALDTSMALDTGNTPATFSSAQDVVNLLRALELHLNHRVNITLPSGKTLPAAKRVQAFALLNAVTTQFARDTGII